MVMIMKGNNVVDKFLDRIGREANKKIVYQRIYQRPSKAKSIVGFVVSLICFIIMLGLFSFTGFFLFLFTFNIILLVFYGVNTFTEKGIPLPKTVSYELPDEEELEKQEEEEEINYFPDADEKFDEEDEETYEEDEERQ